MTSRSWCFTLNNPTTPFAEEWMRNENIKWGVWQMEVGQNGTRHLQGVLTMTAPRRLAYMKDIVPQAHWEKRRGSVKEAVGYVTKEDTRESGPYAVENGVLLTDESRDVLILKLLKVKVNRSDELMEIKSKLDSGTVTVEQIAEEHFELWVRNFRAFEKYQLIKTKPRNHEVEVHVIQGPTGTGKSKWCMDNYPSAY